MKVDNRGRVRFSHNYALHEQSIPLRAEVGPKGTVNIALRSSTWDREEAVDDTVYRDLMGDPQFIEKLAKAQKKARRAGTVQGLLRNYALMGMGSGAAER